MTARTSKKKSTVKKRTVKKKKAVAAKKSSDGDGAVVCFNRDCKLRKKKSCKGFEACPGFQGR